MKKQLLIKITDDSVAGFYLTNSNNLYPDDSGFDLYAPENIMIEPNETVFVDLKVKAQMRSFSCSPISWLRQKSFWNYHGYLMYPRSSISKTPLVLANGVGVIDASYTGNLVMALKNLSNFSYEITAGQRLVQITASDLASFKITTIDRLRDTTRITGFGSTGM
jgi:dUTP pyrophosphatase